MLKSSELTNGERLLIQRRRDEMTIADAAEWHGVSQYTYRRWERDEEQGPRCKLGRLEFREASYILRRREGLTVAAFAKVLGVSPWWLRQMETGAQSDERLREHWDRPRRGRRKARRA